jgi:hypothetical protein
MPVKIKIVTPTRQFVDPICSTCDDADGTKEYDTQLLPEVMAAGEKANGKSTFLSALRMILYTHGYTVQGKRVVQAMRWIERERKTRNMPITAMASYYGIDVTKTKLFKKPFVEGESTV